MATLFRCRLPPSATAPTSQSTAAANPIHDPAGDERIINANIGGWRRVLLTAVLTLIVVLYFISRRILPGGAFAGRTVRPRVQILGAPPGRHRILLVQVGGGFLSLPKARASRSRRSARITDLDEAAALIGQLGGDQRAMAAF
jgi:hypothetical protein